MTLISNCLATCSLIVVLVGSCSLPGTPNVVGDSVVVPPNLEIPSYEAEEHIINYEGFTVSYNHATLVPNWVAYELTDTELNGYYDTKSSNFSRDPNIKGKQASREDYSRSGWDKGHMCPKADLRWSEKAYWESHYFPNICPQNHDLNRYDWNTLEKRVRSLAGRYDTVWVVCGPIFEKKEFGTIGDANVQVPDYFFKALLICTADGFSSVACVMHNDGQHHKLRDYACTVNELEQRIGRDLFPALDDSIEETVEDTIDWHCWEK